MILPTIGSSGQFTLTSPFDAKVSKGEKLTCQAIRRLSDYLSNNETPWETIYKANGLTETDYDSDREADMYIVSLQSSLGSWLYVPAKYIATYPKADGIPYRAFIMGVAFPPMEATRDFSHIETDIVNLVKASLGVTPTINKVQTSGIVLVTKEVHEQTLVKRQIVANGRTTDYARYQALLTEHQQLLDKLAALEAFIKANNGFAQ